jgi:hypothetical protein
MPVEVPVISQFFVVIQCPLGGRKPIVGAAIENKNAFEVHLSCTTS